MKLVGEPCAGKLHARFDGGPEDVEDTDDLVRHPLGNHGQRIGSMSYRSSFLWPTRLRTDGVDGPTVGSIETAEPHDDSPTARQYTDTNGIALEKRGPVWRLLETPRQQRRILPRQHPSPRSLSAISWSEGNGSSPPARAAGSAGRGWLHLPGGAWLRAA